MKISWETSRLFGIFRKMTEVGVSSDVIIDSFRKRKWSWILPFQFVTSARYNPKYEQYIEEAMLKCLAEMSKDHRGCDSSCGYVRVYERCSFC